MEKSTLVDETIRQQQTNKREELAMEFTKAYIMSGRSYSEYNTLVDQGFKAADEFLARLNKD